ncbi:recombinase family protein [Clostridium baratii]|uniref:recombinase family protein n=1 Tax=Clostridium baratii TaxID=1561 RepID=UPI0030CB06D8
MNRKVYGYARVSSKEQNLDRQIKALESYGVDTRDIISDKQSGKNFDREGYLTLKNILLRPKDTLVITELDRLGRNMSMIKDEWNDLQKKQISIVVLDNPILNTEGKNDLEKNLISNLVFELLAYLAEKEREKIKKRQLEGIEALKIRNGGKGIGRPAIGKPDNWNKVYNMWKEKEITAVAAMELLKLKKNTFYKLVKEHENRQ